MFPAYLIRAGIDWVRHNGEFQDSNPIFRCEQSIKICQDLWGEQMGKSELSLLEQATIADYWAEFFHAEEQLNDEKEWKEGLIKRSGQYDSFEEWQDWFKNTYAKVYKDDNVWIGVLMTSWAHTHQYEVRYTDDAWEFRPATPYLPTSEMWRLEPHMNTAAEIINEMWLEELPLYAALGFTIEEQALPYLGKVECLGFDRNKYSTTWPPRANREKIGIELGDMVADIVVPPGDDWYRHLDNVIFAHDYIDVTALVTRAKYVLGSRRRLFELTVEQGYDRAKAQAVAEGWLVPDMEIVPSA